jgi:hypothetical protein
MNDETYLAGDLLAELREAYQSLPRHVQVRVAGLLRESFAQEQPDIEIAG